MSIIAAIVEGVMEIGPYETLIGKPVPTVDVEVLKEWWREGEEFKGRYGNAAREHARGVSTMEEFATGHRAGLIWALRKLSQHATTIRAEVKEPKEVAELDVLERWFNTDEPSEAVFHAMAVLPMIWPDPLARQEGRQKEREFDFEELARLCEAA